MLIAVRPATAEAGRKCDWTAIAEHLGAGISGIADDGVVITHVFPGPEIVWRTRHRVVGAPYGNAASLGDTMAFFGATDDGAARRIADRRGAALVLVCGTDRERTYYTTAAGRDLFSRLARGRPPEWLAPIALPPALGREFRLFRVVGPGAS